MARSVPIRANTYYGLYTLDTFDIDERLSADRRRALEHRAASAVGDRLGTSPDLNSNQTYTHFNPVTGLTYKLTPDLTAYFGYSQSNRAPTPLELACCESDEARACLENFLVSDPPLKQVVASTYEAGLRQQSAARRRQTRMESRAVPHQQQRRHHQRRQHRFRAAGFFQNVPGTRRQGSKRASSISPPNGSSMRATA